MELSQVIAMFVDEVIETPLPPAILLSLLLPATVTHLALHGPSHNPPDQDLHLVSDLTLIQFTVFPLPVRSDQSGNWGLRKITNDSENVKY